MYIIYYSFPSFGIEEEKKLGVHNISKIVSDTIFRAKPIHKAGFKALRKKFMYEIYYIFNNYQCGKNDCIWICVKDSSSMQEKETENY